MPRASTAACACLDEVAMDALCADEGVRVRVEHDESDVCGGDSLVLEPFVARRAVKDDNVVWDVGDEVGEVLGVEILHLLAGKTLIARDDVEPFGDALWFWSHLQQELD
jgi:hypothetical protein